MWLKLVEAELQLIELALPCVHLVFKRLLIRVERLLLNFKIRDPITVFASCIADSLEVNLEIRLEKEELLVQCIQGVLREVTHALEACFQLFSGRSVDLHELFGVLQLEDEVLLLLLELIVAKLHIDLVLNDLLSHLVQLVVDLVQSCVRLRCPHCCDYLLVLALKRLGFILYFLNYFLWNAWIELLLRHRLLSVELQPQSHDLLPLLDLVLVEVLLHVLNLVERVLQIRFVLEIELAILHVPRNDGLEQLVNKSPETRFNLVAVGHSRNDVLLERRLQFLDLLLIKFLKHLRVDLLFTDLLGLLALFSFLSLFPGRSFAILSIFRIIFLLVLRPSLLLLQTGLALLLDPSLLIDELLLGVNVALVFSQFGLNGLAFLQRSGLLRFHLLPQG